MYTSTLSGADLFSSILSNWTLACRGGSRYARMKKRCRRAILIFHSSRHSSRQQALGCIDQKGKKDSDEADKKGGGEFFFFFTYKRGSRDELGTYIKTSTCRDRDVHA